MRTDGGSRGDNVSVPVDVDVEVTVYDLDSVNELTSVDVGDPGVLVGVGLERGRQEPMASGWHDGER